MAPTAFFEDLGDGRFAPTSATVGPWGPTTQHGSPPAALLGRAIERGLARDDARIARVTFDFLGPVAVDTVGVEYELLRPGARVALSRASLSAAGRVAMEARAWSIAVSPGRSPPVPNPEPPPPLPGPQERRLFVDVPAFGYGEALEWRFVEGSFEGLGPATVYARPRVPLIEGEEPRGLTRLLLMVDSANGISAELQPSRYTFVPVELTVAVHRHPRTEWVGMRARTTLDPEGIGQVRADLFDEEGFVGTAVQTLFVAPLPPARAKG